MAKINFTNLSFNPVTVAGVVDHRLRLFPAGATPTPSEVYDAPFASCGMDGVIDQAEITGLGGANVEGKFDLYLTSFDGANESDFVVKQNVPLDLVAPPAPSWN